MVWRKRKSILYDHLGNLRTHTLAVNTLVATLGVVCFARKVKGGGGFESPECYYHVQYIIHYLPTRDLQGREEWKSRILHSTHTHTAHSCVAKCLRNFPVDVCTAFPVISAETAPLPAKASVSFLTAVLGRTQLFLCHCRQP